VTDLSIFLPPALSSDVFNDASKLGVATRVDLRVARLLDEGLD